MALTKMKTRHAASASSVEQMGLQDGKTFPLSSCTGYSELCWIAGPYSRVHVLRSLLGEKN